MAFSNLNGREALRHSQRGPVEGMFGEVEEVHG